MAIRKPLIIIGGQVQEQPAGDTPAGAEPAVPAPTSDATGLIVHFAVTSKIAMIPTAPRDALELH